MNFENETDLHSSYIWYNPLITYRNDEVWRPLKIKRKTRNCKNYTVHDLLLNPRDIDDRRPLFEYLKKMKTSVQDLNQIYTDNQKYLFEKKNRITYTAQTLHTWKWTKSKIYKIIKKKRINTNKSWNGQQYCNQQIRFWLWKIDRHYITLKSVP